LCGFAITIQKRNCAYVSAIFYSFYKMICRLYRATCILIWPTKVSHRDASGDSVHGFVYSLLVCLFVFISSTMRFSRYGLGASSPLITVALSHEKSTSGSRMQCWTDNSDDLTAVPWVVPSRLAHRQAPHRRVLGYEMMWATDWPTSAAAVVVALVVVHLIFRATSPKARQLVCPTDEEVYGEFRDVQLMLMLMPPTTPTHTPTAHPLRWPTSGARRTTRLLVHVPCEPAACELCCTVCKNLH
jgi:hypothetical protein